MKWTALAVSQGGAGKPNHFIQDSHRFGHTDLCYLRIFILEGLLTVVIACTVPFLLFDDPTRARFLSQDERNFVAYRVQTDLGRDRMQSQNDESFKMKYF